MDALFSPTVSPLERFDHYFDHVHDRLAELQRSVRLHPRVPSSEHWERSQHTRPACARYGRSHLGSQDKVFRVRYPGRACARVDCGAGSRSQGEGAVCLLPRHARPGANSKRRRVAPRFQTGRNGCFRRETRTRYLFVNLSFFANFIDD